MLRRNSSVERVIVAMFEELSGAIKSVRTQWFVGLLLGEEMTPPIFCHAILSPTFARLTRELPILFSPALPDVFHSVGGGNTHKRNRDETIHTNPFIPA